MKVCLIASGSKGNSILIDAGRCKLLVDAGLSATELLRRLALIGVEGSEIDAVLLSHEHSDHFRGAGTIARKLKIPVLTSYPTCREIHTSLRKVETIEFESGHSFVFKDFMIDPFQITHDACDPVGFSIGCHDGKVGIATDLGIVTRLVRDKLKGSDVLVLESNHDEEMLRNGPYPWHLKQRIKSRHGHLSNVESAELLDELIHPELKGIFLAHLSEVNNDPYVALRVTESCLVSQDICSPKVIVGNQYQVSEVFTM